MAPARGGVSAAREVETMLTFLRRFFIVLAFFALVEAAGLLYYCLFTSEVRQEGKGVLVFVLLAALMGWLGWRGSPKTLRWAGLSVYMFLLLEAGLQLAGWMGWLRGVNIERHIPYARMYFSKEGLGNDTMNRHGWYDRPVREGHPGRTIAILGDSFILAAGLDVEDMLGARLERLMKAESGATPVQVRQFGIGGITPAHYLELIEYALKYHRPDQLIVSIYFGNDFAHLLLKHSAGDSRGMLYYRPTDSRLEIEPESVAERERFRRKLEFNHLPLVAQLPLAFRSHIMSAHVGKSLRHALGFLSGKSGVLEDNFGSIHAQDAAERGTIAVQRDADADTACAIVAALMEKMATRCREAGVELMFLGIPAFFKEFYEGEGPVSQGLKFDGYNLNLPNDFMRERCSALDLPYASLLDAIIEKGLTREEIRSLYFLNGYGHLRESGHELVALTLQRNLLKSRP